jgi:hypothetical protein
MVDGSILGKKLLSIMSETTESNSDLVILSFDSLGAILVKRLDGGEFG